MRVRTRDNCLSWARFAREHADAGLAALIAAALVLSLAAFDTAAREVAAAKLNTCPAAAGPAEIQKER